MNIPDQLFYTPDHEWVKIDNNIATVGITDYAQNELGDIIFIEFPNIGYSCNSGDSMGTIEAVKTVSDLFSPIKGTVLENNTNLDDNPHLINDDPFNESETPFLSRFTSTNLPIPLSATILFKSF